MDVDTSFHKADVPSLGSGTTNGQSHYPKELQLTVYNPGGTLQQPMTHSQEAEMDKGGCQVLLEGELADCMSNHAGSASSNKRNLRGCVNTSKALGMHTDGSSGQEEPVDPQVKSTGHNGKDDTMSSGNIDSEQVEAALLAKESQDVYQGQNEQGDLTVSSWHLTTT
ncbi:hypothetical protein EDD17DRAFT_1511804 [Pisolithus thermaeus]|nr:hypothetical protein EDD17DRAFT_1511804 [Pisolithus thermaeus]